MEVVDTNNLEDIEAQILSQEQVECPVVHHFGPGVYMREALFPKGSLGIGHKHKHAHTCMLLRGTLAMLVDDEIVIIEAPYIYTAPPGRKMWYAIEDSSFLNILPTEETDLLKIEEQFVEKSDTYLEHEELSAKFIAAVNKEPEQ